MCCVRFIVVVGNYYCDCTTRLRINLFIWCSFLPYGPRLHSSHISLAKSRSRFLVRKRLRYHDFFCFSLFSMPMLLSESADNLLAEPLFGDRNFLYHFFFLYNDDGGLQFGLDSDNVLRARSFSFSNGWPTDSVHIDDEMVGCDRNFGDGGQNGFKLIGGVGVDIFDDFDFDELFVVFCSFGEVDLSFRLRGNGCGVFASIVGWMNAFCDCGACCCVDINGDGASISVTVISGIFVEFFMLVDGDNLIDSSNLSQKLQRRSGSYLRPW